MKILEILMSQNVVFQILEMKTTCIMIIDLLSLGHSEKKTVPKKFIPKIDDKRPRPGNKKKLTRAAIQPKSPNILQIWNYFPNYAKEDHKSLKKSMAKNFGFTEAQFQEMQVKLQQGDESIFEKIFLHHFESCVHYLVKNHKIEYAIAYDISMETLLDFRKKLINNKIAYGNLRFLFTKMASQRHLKEIRADKMKQNLSSFYESEDIEPDLAVLEKALSKMGNACKDLLKLHYYEKISLKDIAALKEIPAATLRKQKQRCVNSLKTLFRQYENKFEKL